jgi:hypothetical protein
MKVMRGVPTNITFSPGVSMTSIHKACLTFALLVTLSLAAFADEGGMKCSFEDHTGGTVLRSYFEIQPGGNQSFKALVLTDGSQISVGYLSGQPLFSVDSKAKQNLLFVRGVPNLEMANPHFSLICE